MSDGGVGGLSWHYRHTLINAISADHLGHGLYTEDTVGENVTVGQVLYMKADGKYWLADADSSATMPACVMVMESISADASGKLLHLGYYRDDTWNWTLGNGIANLLFVDTTAGAIVQYANIPTGTGDQIQCVGYVVTSDIVFFCPEYTMYEVT